MSRRCRCKIKITAHKKHVFRRRKNNIKIRFIISEAALIMKGVLLSARKGYMWCKDLDGGDGSGRKVKGGGLMRQWLRLEVKGRGHIVSDKNTKTD